jgi:hypothetical protein
MIREDFELAMKMRYLDVNHRKNEENKVIFLFIAIYWISFNTWKFTI